MSTAGSPGLSHPARQVLDALAVAEHDVPADLLRKVLRVKRSAVTVGIDEAASRGLLDVLDQGRVRFHHELLRRAVADALSPLVRAEWHRRWALSLQRLDRGDGTDPTALATLAHHRFRSGDADAAVPSAVAAGQAASAIGAATEAAVHWHRALLHWHRADDAVGSTGLTHEAALIEGTTVMRLAGAYADLQEVLTAERALTGTDAVLRLWLDLGLSHLSGRLGQDGAAGGSTRPPGRDARPPLDRAEAATRARHLVLPLVGCLRRGPASGGAHRRAPRGAGGPVGPAERRLQGSASDAPDSR